jgi:hypothetical protein
MAAEEPTTWGEVCKNVSYRDGLYRTCKDKIPEFNGFAAGAFDDRGPEPEQGPDFGSQLARSAQPIPAPPPQDWEPEPENFLGEMFGDLTAEKVVMYGGIAALIWYFFFRKEQAPAAAAPAADKDVTAPRAA